MKLSLGEGEAESCSANTASRLDLNLAAASRIMTALGGQAILSPNCCFCLLPCWSPCRIISFFLCELGGAAAEGPLDHPDSKQNTAANNPLFPPLLSLPCCGRNVFHLWACWNSQAAGRQPTKIHFQESYLGKGRVVVCRDPEDFEAISQPLSQISILSPLPCETRSHVIFCCGGFPAAI